MSFAIAAGIVGSAVVGGYFSNKAAGVQSDAANRGMALSDAQYQQSRQDMMPWLEAGKEGLSTLQHYLGLKRNNLDYPDMPTREQFMRDGKPIYGPKTWTGYGNHYNAPKVTGYTPGEFDQEGFRTAMADYETRKAMLDDIAKQDQTFGSLLDPFTGEDLQNEPGFQFGIDQGNKSLDYAARVSGLGKSGKRFKDAVQWGNDYGEQYFNEAFQRDAANKDRTYNYLAGVGNTGANVNTQMATLGAGNARTMADYLTQGANAQAAGRMATANIFSDAVGTGLNYYQQKQWMDKMYG